MRFGLFPDDYIVSVHDIDYARLYEEGYRAILFDIDNTLVENNAPADAATRAFFKRLHAIGFRIALLSNNKEPRVRKFAEAAEADDFFYKAAKPARSAYEKAMASLQTRRTNTIFIGDQLFTDIWGGNRAGVRTVMVLPIRKWHEEIQIILKRVLEDALMLFYPYYQRGFRGGRPVPLLLSGRRVIEEG